MLALLALLTLFLVVIAIGYWSAHRYPRLRPFRYSHHSEPQLPVSAVTSQMQTMASQYQLHGLVAGCQGDIERIDALRAWVYDRWEPQPGNRAGTDNPLDILTRAQKGERFDPGDYLTVLAHVLQAVDIPTRLLELHPRDSHWRPWGGFYRGLEVFLRDQHRWCWVDAQYDALILNHGVYCNALEIKDALLDRDSQLELSSIHGNSMDRYLSRLAPFLDILIARPLGQQRCIALVPPQLKFSRRRHGFGRLLYDQRCQSRQVFYAHHPLRQELPTPLRRKVFRPHPLSA